MKVLFFAHARYLTKCDEHVLHPAKALSVDEFWADLLAVFPALASLRTVVRLAKNETYLQEGEFLGPNDEIALIPPVSGG